MKTFALIMLVMGQSYTMDSDMSDSDCLWAAKTMNAADIDDGGAEYVCKAEFDL